MSATMPFDEAASRRIEVTYSTPDVIEQRRIVRMRKILAAWDEHLADPYLPRRLTSLLTETGFTVTQRSAIPLFNAGYDAHTFSAGLIGFIAAFVPGRAGVTATDVNAWAEDLTRLGADYFFSLNRYLFLAVK